MSRDEVEEALYELIPDEVGDASGEDLLERVMANLDSSDENAPGEEGEVLHSLSLEITELRVLLPVIVSLRNPALRDRHWFLIGEAIE